MNTSSQKVFSAVLLVIGLLLMSMQFGQIADTVEQVIRPQVGLELRQVAPVPVFNGTTLSNAQQETRDLAFQELVDITTATSIVVIDVPSASILFEKNPRERVFPASTVKLMTAVVSRQLYDNKDELTVLDEVFVDGNIIGLQLNEVITVENLLKGLLIQSGNDAAQVLASSHPQGYAAFIDLMNQEAQRIGMADTFYENPVGLDHPIQTTTARDMAILARAVLQDDFLKGVVSIRTTTIEDERQQYLHQLTNTNQLLQEIDGVRGMKTGTTPWAKQALITYFEQDEREIVIVVLGSEDRYTDTQQVMKWIEEHYQWYEFESEALQSLVSK